MVKKLLSREENVQLTFSVLQYNSMRNGKMKSELEKRLREKTELLIYYLPLSNGYLNLEEASEFFIEQKKNALSLLRAYTISKLNYHEFLTQVLRKRCITFRIRKKTEESEVARLHYEEGRMLIEETIAKEHYPLYEFSHRTRIDTSDMDIRDLAEFMVKNRQEITGEVLDEAEAYLQKKLRKENIRRYFITLLLYIPHVENDYFCLKLACIFELERSVFDKLFELKEIYKHQDKEKRNRQKEIANRHFRVLLRLESAYNITGNENEKKRILEAIEKVRRAMERRQMEIRRTNSGLSQREIAACLGISRSLVCLNIQKAKDILQEAKKMNLKCHGPGH